MAHNAVGIYFKSSTMFSKTNISEAIVAKCGIPSAKSKGFASTLYDATTTSPTIIAIMILFFGVSIIHLHYFFNTHISSLKINNSITFNTNL